MRILICGSRDYLNEAVLATEMNRLVDRLAAEQNAHAPSWLLVTEVIEGEAPGADTFARMWAESWAIPVRKFPADWKRYGKAAGPIRNKQMLDEGKPDLVVAFPTGKLSESRGTLNMVQQARKAGVRVIVIGEDDVPYQYEIEEIP